jgi:hypothetical protein
MTVDEKLTTSTVNGESNISFYPDQVHAVLPVTVQELAVFQATIKTLREYEKDDLLTVTLKHEVKRGDLTFVDHMTVQLTPEGIDHFKKSK